MTSREALKVAEDHCSLCVHQFKACDTCWVAVAKAAIKYVIEEEKRGDDGK